MSNMTLNTHGCQRSLYVTRICFPIRDHSSVAAISSCKLARIESSQRLRSANEPRKYCTAPRSSATEFPRSKALLISSKGLYRRSHEVTWEAGSCVCHDTLSSTTRASVCTKGGVEHIEISCKSGTLQWSASSPSFAKSKVIYAGPGHAACNRRLASSV
ncbi:hypothetical protein PENSPDRAFT_196693 [Peniophora sp. CONT]|nr:hypothetical protein PENSPDRAFT_196693 [Peniophora sp. CONT]